MAHINIQRQGWVQRTRERVKDSARRAHWHAALTHFPISLFGVAFLFQALHFFMFHEAFEMATTVSVVAGAVSMVPAIISGWLTWKRRYHRSKARILRLKIRVAFVMLGASMALSAWRLTLYSLGYQDHGINHYVFFAVTTGLMAGAITEGYYGGRLAHRTSESVCEFEESDNKESGRAA